MRRKGQKTPWASIATYWHRDNVTMKEKFQTCISVHHDIITHEILDSKRVYVEPNRALNTVIIGPAPYGKGLKLSEVPSGYSHTVKIGRGADNLIVEPWHLCQYRTKGSLLVLDLPAHAIFT